MRCLACNIRLTNRESVRRYANSNAFVDLCNRCFSEVAEEIPDVGDGQLAEHPEEIEDYQPQPFGEDYFE